MVLAASALAPRALSLGLMIKLRALNSGLCGLSFLRHCFQDVLEPDEVLIELSLRAAHCLTCVFLRKDAQFVPVEKERLQALLNLPMARGHPHLPQRPSASCPTRPLLPPVLLDQLLQSAAHDQWDIQVCDGWDDLLVYLRLRHDLKVLNRPAPHCADQEGGDFLAQARLLC